MFHLNTYMNNIVPLLNDQANNSAYIALQSITNAIMKTY